LKPFKVEASFDAKLNIGQAFVDVKCYIEAFVDVKPSLVVDSSVFKLHDNELDTVPFFSPKIYGNSEMI